MRFCVCVCGGGGGGWITSMLLRPQVNDLENLITLRKAHSRKAFSLYATTAAEDIREHARYIYATFNPYMLTGTQS